MNFKLTRPCDDCPFLRVGGIRLAESRTEEITDLLLDSQGGTFACHKTTHKDSEEQHCVGALIFMEKHDTATQIVKAPSEM